MLCVWSIHKADSSLRKKKWKASGKSDFLFGRLLLSYFSCVAAAGQECGASWTGCGVCASAAAGEQRGKVPDHNLGTKSDSCSPPIPMLAFGIFQKPDGGKVCLLVVLSTDRAGILLEPPEVEQAAQRNRQSPGLFSSQSLIADPSGTRR